MFSLTGLPSHEVVSKSREDSGCLRKSLLWACFLGVLHSSTADRCLERTRRSSPHMPWAGPNCLSLSSGIRGKLLRWGRKATSQEMGWDRRSSRAGHTPRPHPNPSRDRGPARASGPTAQGTSQAAVSASTQRKWAKGSNWVLENPEVCQQNFWSIY